MGIALAVSGDGNLLATNYGRAVFIFKRNGEEWIQKAKILPNIFDESDHFGETLALSGTEAIFLLVPVMKMEREKVLIKTPTTTVVRILGPPIFSDVRKKAGLKMPTLNPVIQILVIFLGKR